MADSSRKPMHPKIPEVTAIGGLPGSGKTTAGVASDENVHFADDFLANSAGTAASSPKLDQLVLAVESGLEAVVADVAFVTERARADFETTLSRLVPGVAIRWVLYENDAEQCRRNVSEDAFRRDAEKRYSVIYEYSREYEHRPGAEVRRVFRP